jgi:hypothetical protein
MNKHLATELIHALMSSPTLPFNNCKITGVTEIKFNDSQGKRFRIKVHND